MASDAVSVMYRGEEYVFAFPPTLAQVRQRIGVKKGHVRNATTNEQILKPNEVVPGGYWNLITPFYVSKLPKLKIPKKPESCTLM